MWGNLFATQLHAEPCTTAITSDSLLRLPLLPQNCKVAHTLARSRECRENKQWIDARCVREKRDLWKTGVATRRIRA